LIGYSALDNVSFPGTSRVYKASGSLKSFVARHGISGTITSTCRESQVTGKKLRMQGNSVRMEILWWEASQEPKGGFVQDGRDIIYGKRRREVVMEWWCASGSTLLPCHGRENIGGPALTRQGRFTTIVATAKHFRNSIWHWEYRRQKRKKSKVQSLQRWINYALRRNRTRRLPFANHRVPDRTFARYYISGSETVQTGPANPSSPLPTPERRRGLL